MCMLYVAENDNTDETTEETDTEGETDETTDDTESHNVWNNNNTHRTENTCLFDSVRL